MINLNKIVCFKVMSQHIADELPSSVYTLNIIITYFIFVYWNLQEVAVTVKIYSYLT